MVSEQSYQRRKQERPAQITAAAFEAFVEHGYAGTKVADVADKAGISKGLLYLYFKTKEELFRTVVKSYVVPKLDTLVLSVNNAELSAAEFFRGPFLEFAQSIPGSPVGRIVRLLIAEGPKHPDLLQFYWDNVVSRGLAAIEALLEKGIQNGEFRRSPITEQPLLFIMPVVFTTIFELLFAKQGVATDYLIKQQIDLLLEQLEGTDQ